MPTLIPNMLFSTKKRWFSAWRVTTQLVGTTTTTPVIPSPSSSTKVHIAELAKAIPHVYRFTLISNLKKAYNVQMAFETRLVALIGKRQCWNGSSITVLSMIKLFSRKRHRFRTPSGCKTIDIRHRLWEHKRCMGWITQIMQKGLVVIKMQQSKELT